MLNRRALLDYVRGEWFPAFLAERERLNRIDRWYRWDHDKPHQPRHATREYRELAARAQAPWGALIVKTVAQTLYVDGYRRATDPENASSWADWQANGMDARQKMIHESALAYGLSYLTILPGEDPLTGDARPTWRGVSPRRMIAFYEDPAWDDWPKIAMEATPTKVSGAPGWVVNVYDDTTRYRLQADSGGGSVDYVTQDEHDAGVCPIVRFANTIDLEGRSHGEVEPYISVLGRIDQTSFDRLVVQRFASWIVRTIAGMTQPTNQTDAEREKQRLKVEDILIAEDKDTKFSSLPASPMDGLISAHDSDIKVLAAVSQTPAYELLGELANLSAEALAAVRASATAKSGDNKIGFGESWEQGHRLSAWTRGDKEGARDMAAQVRWRDTEIRSLAQASDALGKLATMLGIPPEVLWEKVPGLTQQDIELAKKLVSQAGGMDALLQQLTGATAA